MKDMVNIPSEALVKRRLELLAEIDRLNVRINEIERWLQLAQTVSVGTPIQPTVTTARNPRTIKKEQSS